MTQPAPPIPFGLWSLRNGTNFQTGTTSGPPTSPPGPPLTCRKRRRGKTFNLGKYRGSLRSRDSLSVVVTRVRIRLRNGTDFRTGTTNGPPTSPPGPPLTCRKRRRGRTYNLWKYRGSLRSRDSLSVVVSRVRRRLSKMRRKNMIKVQEEANKQEEQHGFDLLL